MEGLECQEVRSGLHCEYGKKLLNFSQRNAEISFLFFSDYSGLRKDERGGVVLDQTRHQACSAQELGWTGPPGDLEWCGEVD